MTTRKIRTTLFTFATALFLAILVGCGTTSTSAASSTTPAGSSAASTTTPTSATGAMSSTAGMPMPAAPAGPHKQADIYVGNTKHLAGGPMLGNSVSSSISNVMDRAGIPGTPHALRHWFGTALREAGVDSLVIKELMGHESLATTAIYVDVPLKQRTAAVDRLPRVHSGWGRSTTTSHPRRHPSYGAAAATDARHAGSMTTPSGVARQRPGSGTGWMWTPAVPSSRLAGGHVNVSAGARPQSTASAY